MIEKLYQQLPALQIVIPLFCAPLCVLLRASQLCWALAMAVTWSSLGVSIVLLERTLKDGAIFYQMGDWAREFGIEYSVNPTNAFVLIIVTGISAVVLTAAPRSVASEIPRPRHYLFYTAYLLCMTGLVGMTITGDAFNTFVFLEISSLSSYILISQGTSRRALTSAYRYLIMGTVGGTFILLGIGLLYMATGTLNIIEMVDALNHVSINKTLLSGLVFITVGTSLKLGLFPLHFWLPNAYTYAPSIVTAFLAATATKVAFFVLARFTFTYAVLGKSLSFTYVHIDKVLLPLALAAMFVGSLAAIFQKDIKRSLAYSSVAQVGYMVLGLSYASVTGLTGGIVHLFNHALMKSGLFLIVACVVLRLGSSHISSFKGLGRRMPVTMFGFVLGGLSLIGVPLTVGFVSKWYLVTAALEAGSWLVAGMILLSSLLALIYIWRVVEVAYLEKPDSDEPVKEAPASMLIPAWCLILACIYFGIFTEHSASVAEVAAKTLLGVAP